MPHDTAKAILIREIKELEEDICRYEGRIQQKEEEVEQLKKSVASKAANITKINLTLEALEKED